MANISCYLKKTQYCPIAAPKITKINIESTDHNQERIKVREVIPHIGPIPIVIPLKLFLDLPRDPVSQEG